MGIFEVSSKDSRHVSSTHKPSIRVASAVVCAVRAALGPRLPPDSAAAAAAAIPRGQQPSEINSVVCLWRNCFVTQLFERY